MKKAIPSWSARLRRTRAALPEKFEFDLELATKAPRKRENAGARSIGIPRGAGFRSPEIDQPALVSVQFLASKAGAKDRP